MPDPDPEDAQARLRDTRVRASCAGTFSVGAGSGQLVGTVRVEPGQGGDWVGIDLAVPINRKQRRARK